MSNCYLLVSNGDKHLEDLCKKLSFLTAMLLLRAFTTNIGDSFIVKVLFVINSCQYILTPESSGVFLKYLSATNRIRQTAAVDITRANHGRNFNYL